MLEGKLKYLMQQMVLIQVLAEPFHNNKELIQWVPPVSPSSQLGTSHTSTLALDMPCSCNMVMDLFKSTASWQHQLVFPWGGSVMQLLCAGCMTFHKWEVDLCDDPIDLFGNPHFCEGVKTFGGSPCKRWLLVPKLLASKWLCNCMTRSTRWLSITN